MANSAYWYGKYKEYVKEIDKYEKYIKQLNKILGNYGEFEDEKNAVNREMGDLIDALKDGVRHNSVFKANANNLESKKEKSADADSYLSQSKGGVEAEISELSRKKAEAEGNRDEAWRRYESDKETERQEEQERLRKLAEMLLC